MPGEVSRIDSIGKARVTSTAKPPTIAKTGRRMTARAMAAQPRGSAPGCARGHAALVDPVAKEAKHGWQQRQRGEHGHDGDDDRASAKAAHDGGRHQQQPGEGDHHGDAAEQHGAVGGVARDGHGITGGATLREFLAEPLHHHQRVVDAKR